MDIRQPRQPDSSEHNTLTDLVERALGENRLLTEEEMAPLNLEKAKELNSILENLSREMWGFKPQRGHPLDNLFWQSARLVLQREGEPDKPNEPITARNEETREGIEATGILINQELIERAEKLSIKCQKMLKRNGGEYPEQDLRMSDEDSDVIRELKVFFEEDCRAIPLIQGVERGDQQLKRISDDVWLLKETWLDYDVTYNEYSVIDGGNATKSLRTGVEERRRRIQELQAQNQAAMRLLGESK